MIRRLALVLLMLALAAPALAAELRPFGRGSWDSLRAAHAGRPLIVHLWSLSCAPCLVELPQWSRVRGADVVLVATDPIEQAPRLNATLRKAGLAEGENWAFADPYSERLRFEIDRRWRGELPRTLLIAADGTTEAVAGIIPADQLTQWLARQR